MVVGGRRVPSCIWYLAAATCLLSLVQSSPPPRPHIIMILADDMGWNDVGFHGADDVSTPNLDALAYSGIMLNQHYTLPLCTPSRAALLTGKYPIRTGMHHLVILEDEPWGLGLEQKILPEYLREVGYQTHAIGKWHLGFYRKEYTPTFRGFQSHFGYWQGYQDYYNHSVKPEHISIDGYDMHRNMEPAWDVVGEYSTDLFTKEAVKLIKQHKQNDGPMFLYLSHLAPHTGSARDPLQAPYETIAKFKHIPDLERRIYAAMVSKLDDSVGEVVAALQATGMLDNSVIMFVSDNGGATIGDHSNKASNYPLRGMKAYPWEGGTRGLAAVWSPLFKQTQAISNQMVHLVDWLPTLASLAGVEPEELEDLDGFNVWPHISEGLTSPRSEFLYNIDSIDYPYAAVRKDKWKFVNGTPHAEYNDWFGHTARNQSVSYSAESVVQSKVASTISGYYMRRAILNNNKRGKTRKPTLTEEDMMSPPLTVEKVLNLRKISEIVCLSKMNSLPWSRWEECDPLVKPCLFDLDWDPCEEYNIAKEYPEIAEDMRELLEKYNKMKIEPRNKPGEAEANPAFWNNVYSCWHDELDHKVWINRVIRTSIIAGICLLGLVFLIPGLTALANKSKTRNAKHRMLRVVNLSNDPTSTLTGSICVASEK